MISILDKLFFSWVIMIVPIILYAFWEINYSKREYRYLLTTVYIVGIFVFLMLKIWS